MTAYSYSVIRFFPRPHTGEFVNAGLLVWGLGCVGWSRSSIGHLKRAGATAAQLEMVQHYLDYVRRTAGSDGTERLTEWVDEERAAQQNSIQWSEIRGCSFANFTDATTTIRSQLLTTDID